MVNIAKHTAIRDLSASLYFGDSRLADSPLLGRIDKSGKQYAASDPAGRRLGTFDSIAAAKQAIWDVAKTNHHFQLQAMKEIGE